MAARKASAVIPTRRNGRRWKQTTPGARARNEVLHATRSCMPPAVSADRSGDPGAAIIDEAGWRPGCGA